MAIDQDHDDDKDSVGGYDDDNVGGDIYVIFLSDIEKNEFFFLRHLSDIEKVIHVVTSEILVKSQLK